MKLTALRRNLLARAAAHPDGLVASGAPHTIEVLLADRLIERLPRPPEGRKPYQHRITAAGRAALLALLVVLASACSGSLRHVNAVGASLTAMALACDYGQTRSAAAAGWAATLETNPVMGGKPDTGTVDMYFAATSIAILGLAQLLPERVRPAAYGLVVAVQAHTIAGNMTGNMGKISGGLCGLER